MSWDVELVEDGKCVKVPVHAEGGTYAWGGTTEAELNVTYNYGKLFATAMGNGNLRGLLDGKTAEETVGVLGSGVEVLGTLKYGDYWAPTPGNAGWALNILLGWARANPNAVWKVT